MTLLSPLETWLVVVTVGLAISNYIFIKRIRMATQETMQANDRANRYEQLATIDPQTGLINRRGFELLSKDLDRQLARKALESVVVIMIDLDHFKEVNDTEGHAKGDEVLCEAASLIESVARAGDSVVRLGGDEFVFVARNVIPSDVRVIMERIRQRIETRFNREEVAVTATLGAAIALQSGMFKQVLCDADKALYEAKDAGRNCFVLAETAALTG